MSQKPRTIEQHKQELLGLLTKQVVDIGFAKVVKLNCRNKSYVLQAAIDAKAILDKFVKDTYPDEV